MNLKIRICCLPVLWIALCVTGCARDTSPVIVCKMNDAYVETGFTFDEFKKALDREHGLVLSEANKLLRSKHMEIKFQPIEDGRLLATDVVMLSDWQEVEPAVLFGLDTTKEVVPESDVKIELTPEVLE